MTGAPSMENLLGVLLDALADRLAHRINSPREREVYSSSDLPPRCSRRRFAEVCRSGRVADARREGREWTCSRAAWRAARARAVKPAASPVASFDSRASALLARSGLRVVRGEGAKS